jgi:UDP-glucose 4-epimerase
VRILITGGLGFIGSHLAKYYLDKGDEVIIVDNLSTGDINRLAKEINNSTNLRLLFCDVNTQSPSLNWQHIRDEFGEGIDYVYHYSACVGVKRTQQNPELVLNDIMGITNIILLCREFHVKKFIFVSSSEVYGENEKANEDSELCYDTPYMIVKRFGEKICTETNTTGVLTYAIRLFNVYGLGQSKDFLIGNIFDKIKNNDKDFVIYDSNAKRDFVYIQDNIDATVHIAERGKPGEIYNICTGQGEYIGNVLGMIEEITGKKFNINYSKRDDIKIRGGNNTKLIKDTGFKFRYTLERGLQEMWVKIK